MDVDTQQKNNKISNLRCCCKPSASELVIEVEDSTHRRLALPKGHCTRMVDFSAHATVTPCPTAVIAVN